MRFLSCKCLIKCAAAKDAAIRIAEEVGFESILYFIRVFKAETGVSPLSFCAKIKVSVGGLVFLRKKLYNMIEYNGIVLSLMREMEFL